MAIHETESKSAEFKCNTIVFIEPGATNINSI